MCGRMTTTTSADEIAKQFEAAVVAKEAAERQPSYNVAPTQDIIVVSNQSNDSDEREVRTMHWGLVPFFAKDTKGSARMINARAENVADKPAYRRAFKKRRCIIPADGYYEWEKVNSKTKQPWYFQDKSGQLLAFAGLWEIWHDPNQPEDADPLVSCTIITADANSNVQSIHNRMPLALTPEEVNAWLSPENNERPDELKKILKSPAEGQLEFWRISTDVNKVANNGEQLILPFDPNEKPINSK